MVLSSSSFSHTPSTIFPDTPNTRRNAGYGSVQPLPAVASPGSPGLSPYSRSDASRRHTVYLSPASPRREARPLRSSPLAGPAVSHDGTITGSDESSEESGKPRYRPNRISSSPDVASLSGLSVSSDRASASAPGSPTGTLRGNPPPPQPLDLPGYGSKFQPEAISPPESAVTSNRVKRLSRGIKALTSLPGLPSLPLKTNNNVSNTDGEQLPARRHSEGERHSKRPAPSEEVPAVPAIPVWALPSHAPSPPTPQRETLRPESCKPTRRPSTAPSVSSKRSVRSLASSPSTSSLSSQYSQYSQHSRTMPSTSRDPELNWMTAAAPPKFSRLSLKAEGVVLPVSAKAARRKSTVSVLSLVPEDPDADKPKAQQKDNARALRSVKRPPSLKSLASATHTGDTIETPVPPFRSASASTSSVASSASGSDAVRTPSLSHSRTTSPASSVEDLGVMSQDHGVEGHGGVELRVNDVTVEIIGMSNKEKEKNKVETKATSVTFVVQPPEAKPLKVVKEPKQQRRGTLKRVWKRMFGSVRG